MKKAGKIILYFILSFVAILVILIVVAALAENKIAKIAIEQIGKTTNIPIKLDEVEFSLVHDFPFATIQCNNILVSSPVNADIIEQDTIVYAPRLYVVVQTRKLIKGIFEIRKVEISDAELSYKIDTTGMSNLDFLNYTTQQNTSDTSVNAIFLDIKSLKIENTIFHYRDKKQNATADLKIDQLDLTGIMDSSHFLVDAKGKASLSNCSYDTTNLHLMKQTVFDFKLKYEADTLFVDYANIGIDDDLRMTLNGTVNLRDKISTEMIVKAEKLDLGNLSKYVPEKYFHNYGIENFTGILTSDAKISGIISDSIMPAIEADFNFTQGNLTVQDYPAIRRISMSGAATNGRLRNNSTTSINIKSLNFQTTKSKGSLSGNIENLDHLKYNITSTLDIDLDEVSPFIPDSLLKSITGNVKATISTKGTLPDSISDEYLKDVLANSTAKLQLANVGVEIDSLLSVNQLNAHLDYQSNQILVNQFRAGMHYDTIDVDSINLDAKIVGNPLNYDSLDIQFSRFDAVKQSNNISLSGTVRNPLNPDFNVQGKLTLNLAEIQKYIPDSLVNSLSGNVSATFESAAQLHIDSIRNQINDLLFEHSKFQVNLSQVDAEMPDSMLSIKNFSGQLMYPSDSLWIDQFNGSYQGIQFAMNSVTAANIYSTVIQNQKKELVVHGNFSVGDLDYAKIEKLLETDSAAIAEPENEPMNFTYKVNGRFKVNSLKYEDVLYSNISSKFLIKENYYVFDSLNLDAFDGHAQSSVKVEMKPENEMTLFYKTDIRKMNITKLVQSFSQYIDYEDFKSENVRGIFSTKMDGEIVMKNFEPEYESLKLKGDLTIENGALFNVKPVMEVEKIPGVGLKNMDSLYFSTLNSSVFLFNNELYIPRTEIRSSSFDAMFLGMYSFGVDYAYHIRMFLGEVLSSKSKANLRKLTQEGGFDDEEDNDVTKGRTSIYVVSKSENGKEKAGFDKKKDRQNMVAKVNLQKQMVDMRFHPALVKYDTEQ